MTNLIIHPEVANDLTEGAQWYQKIDPELAECFLEEAYQANCEQWPSEINDLDASERPLAIQQLSI